MSPPPQSIIEILLYAHEGAFWLAAIIYILTLVFNLLGVSKCNTCWSMYACLTCLLAVFVLLFFVMARAGKDLSLGLSTVPTSLVLVYLDNFRVVLYTGLSCLFLNGIMLFYVGWVKSTQQLNR